MIALAPLQHTRDQQIDPDAQLMEAAGAGDYQAFETLVDRYYDRVVSVIEHLMGGRHQSHDLAQEVFLRIYRARKTYQARSKFSTWLFVIVNNVVRNARRSLARRREVLVGIPTSSSDRLVDGSLDDRRRIGPADSALRGELQDVVRSAVDDLKGRQRTAIMLYHFGGLSYAEVAKEMETTLCAAKALLHRARQSLRGQLQKYENA